MRSQSDFVSRIRLSGFSLIETVIVLFLAGLMLGAVILLTRQTLSTLKFLQEKGTTIQSATLGCERLCSEMREMIALNSLAGDQIAFSKVTPSSPIAVNNPIASPPDPIVPPPTHTWTRSYTNLVTVDYRKVGEDMIRQVSGDPAALVATSVSGLAITSGGPVGTFRVELTIKEERRLVSYVNFVSCPGIPRP